MLSVLRAAMVGLLILLCMGCGGSSSSTPPATPTSAWAGTYTGNLNLSGCPSQNPCGGDSLTLVIGQAYNPPEFSQNLTLSGTDTTAGQPITGTGDTLGISPASQGPGTSGENATLTTSMSVTSFSVVGSGSSTSNALVLIQTLLIYDCAGPVDIATANCGGNRAYLGTLTRQQ